MIVRKTVSIVSPSAQKCIDNFHLLCFWAFLERTLSWIGKLGVRFLRIWSSSIQRLCPHSPRSLSLLVESHVFSDPEPRNDQRLSGFFFANKDPSVTISNAFLFIVFNSPYDVIEHRHEENSSLEVFWVVHLVHELLDFLDELQCSESWEDIPLEFHRFSVNCVQNFVLWWIFERIQLSYSNSIWCWVLIHLSKT